MGQSCAVEVPDDDPSYYRNKVRSREVDDYLKKYNRDYNNEAKILILGSGDSGKSTFLRQIKHLNGVDTGLESEKLKFTSVIKQNCLKSFKEFLMECEQKELDIPKNLKEKVESILNCDEIDDGVGGLIEKVWNNKKMKKNYQNIEVYLQIPTNSPHFWKNAETIFHEDYVPTKDDIILAKIRTIGIQETHFVLNDIKFLLVDVGGQRSERRKWLHCFNNINAVIFLTAIDEYDGKVLEEDNHTNRLLDSLSLFEKLSESSWFETVPFILFLNKMDLFTSKIKYKPLEEVFDDFSQVIEENHFDKENKLSQSTFYMKHLFLKRFKGSNLFPFETNSTDEKICQNVFTSIREDIIMKKLQNII